MKKARETAPSELRCDVSLGNPVPLIHLLYWRCWR